MAQRIMGIDLGEKRTGVAVSDLTGTLASDFCLLEVSGLKDAAKKISDIANEQKITKIVVGYPLNMNGTEGKGVERVQILKQFLIENNSNLDVVFLDERLTTSLAHVYLSASNASRKKRKQTIDVLSARIILQNYIDITGNGS